MFAHDVIHNDHIDWLHELDLNSEYSVKACKHALGVGLNVVVVLLEQALPRKEI